MKCPVCGSEMKNDICPVCGFDSAADVLAHPTPSDSAEASRHPGFSHDDFKFPDYHEEPTFADVGRPDDSIAHRESAQNMPSAGGAKAARKMSKGLGIGTTASVIIVAFALLIIIFAQSAKAKDGAAQHVEAPQVKVSDATGEQEAAEPSPSEQPDASSSPAAPAEGEAFYGIWIGASKSDADAERFAENARSAGLDAKVFITTDWSNLNSEKYYVVAAGTYLTEDDAQNELSRVQGLGYADAYVKYSGEHK